MSQPASNEALSPVSPSDRTKDPTSTPVPQTRSQVSAKNKNNEPDEVDSINQPRDISPSSKYGEVSRSKSPEFYDSRLPVKQTETSESLVSDDIKTSTPQPRRNAKLKRRREVEPEITSAEMCAELKGRDFKFVKLSTIPHNDEQAIHDQREGHVEESEPGKSQQSNDWKRQATKSFDERLKHNFVKYPKKRPYTGWSTEIKNGSNVKLYGEGYHKSALRHCSAAAANALLNAAVVPPLGYSGCIKDLLLGERLTPEELTIVTAGTELLQMLHQRSDEWVTKVAADKLAAERLAAKKLARQKLATEKKLAKKEKLAAEKKLANKKTKQEKQGQGMMQQDIN